MKLLFDQNISFRILKLLPEPFGESRHVTNQGLLNEPDKIVWDFAKKNNFTIVTQDSDFNDLNIFLGFPPKIIWIRTGNLGTMELAKIIVEHQEELNNFIAESSYGCFEMINSAK